MNYIPMITAAVLAFSLPAAADTQCTDQVCLAVHAQDTDPLTLDVELTNRGNRTIRMLKAYLPWNYHGSIMLLVARLGSSEGRLKEQLPVQDPGPDSIELVPGQVLKGRIDLRRRFWDIEEQSKAHDLILFWSYALKPQGEPALDRVSGGVVISQRPPAR
jgi:hypothetical protein